MTEEQQRSFRDLVRNLNEIPTASELKEFFESSGCPLPVNAPRSNKKLDNFLTYARRVADTSAASFGSETISSLMESMKQFQVDPSSAAMDDVVVLPELSWDDATESIFIPFTCPGLLRAAAMCPDRHLCLCCDGKWSILQDGWCIVSIGWLCKSRERGPTTVARFLNDGSGSRIAVIHRRLKLRNRHHGDLLVYAAPLPHSHRVDFQIKLLFSVPCTAHACLTLGPPYCCRFQFIATAT